MPEEKISADMENSKVEPKAAADDREVGDEDKARQTVGEMANPLNERIALLEQDLTAREQELERYRTLVREHEESRDTLNVRHDAAVAAYRVLLLKANPLVPSDLISGGTIEEVDQSLQRAAGLVGQIRQGLEQMQQAGERADAIPAGAPGRTPPDLSTMSTREKINYGLEQTRQNR